MNLVYLADRVEPCNSCAAIVTSCNFSRTAYGSA